ncbi:cellulose synthase-like protein E2 [Salvia splendens]|uniref:cellulose synthase-like protein E2 n=1 Tax=Salvia splendens TaxID=180675 RepID=UPI001C26473D|nr:cellulose synthase-like protein E2 [Salvia splendens]
MGGLFGAEIWFGFYWMLSQSHRWNRVNRRTFKDRLCTWITFNMCENDLGGVNIFVCTADPEIEPPMLVINTVLSVMAYDYPPEKLAVYLSDDAASDLTFYALLEASAFAKALLKLYEDMENRIELAKKLGTVSKSTLIEHTGFSSWDSYTPKTDHDAILHILIDRDGEATDVEGCRLPTLVYLAREKRPRHVHNFKAGAMNALIRVSSEISNGPIILNVDCDMYSNDSQSIRDALCFFLDEGNGHEVA